MLLKTKLSLGLGFLFLIIFMLAGFCSYYVGKSAQEAGNILKDNYDSIVFAKKMISGLGDMMTSVTGTVFNPAGTGAKSNYYRELFDSGKKEFEVNLKAENNNITEVHEKEFVEKLNHDYEVYMKLCLMMKNGANGKALYFSDFLPVCDKLKQSINDIYEVNLQAVVRKSGLARKDSANFKSTMAVIGALCFILALGYFWYFPLYISNTISYLANRMKNLLSNMGIAFEANTKDEAFVLLSAINLLENKFGFKNADKK